MPAFGNHRGQGYMEHIVFIIGQKSCAAKHCWKQLKQCLICKCGPKSNLLCSRFQEAINKKDKKELENIAVKLNRKLRAFLNRNK